MPDKPGQDGVENIERVQFLFHGDLALIDDGAIQGRSVKARCSPLLLIATVF